MAENTAAKRIETRSIPIPSVRRLPKYLRFLKELRDGKETIVSCTQIAKRFGQLNVQVRKDLALTGAKGRPKVGYEILGLIESIEHFLDWNTTHTAIIVGAGHLGTAILGYAGVREFGLNIICALDSEPKKIGLHIHGRPIYDIKDLEKIIAQNGAKIGLLTVPANQAQSVAKQLVEAGVRAIWNFTSVHLEIPPGIHCEDAQLSTSFAVLSCSIKHGVVMSIAD